LPKKGRILVGAFQTEKAQAMANAARAAGYEAETAATGKDLMRRLKDRADIDAIILDSELPYPPLPDTIASLRYDVHLGLLPVRIVYTPDLGPATTYYISDTNRRVEVGVPAGALETANLRAEMRLKVLIEGYKQIGVVRGPLSPAIVQTEFSPPATAEQVGGSPALTDTEKKSQSVRAIEWFKRMATGEVYGYDVRPAERTIRQALRSDDLAAPAIVATSRLPGADPQADLAALIADGGRSTELRLAAADGLIRHISSHGVALTKQQGQTLMDLLPTLTDPILKARVATVVGSLHLTSPQSGQRLLRYNPLPSKPAATLEAPKAQ
jgi:CheY-like chemotaxis protein